MSFIPTFMFAATTTPVGDGEIFSVAALIALVTLTALEIVLGIDNVVFIAILAGKLPENQRARARRIGLGLAMGMRIVLLLAIGWVMGLTRPLFSIPKFWTAEAGDLLGFSGRDLILFVGGLFLLAKATYEIHDKLEGHTHTGAAPTVASFGAVIVQILLLDIVFSLDSVITAVGMAESIWIMIAAVIIAVAFMMFFAGSISTFVDKHPTMKILALSFLLLIGVMLVVEAFHAHIPKGYIYFAMSFSLGVELINMRIRKITDPVKLHQTYVAEPGK